MTCASYPAERSANYTQKYSEETLGSWRWRGDAIADAAVEAIFEDGRPNGGIHNLLPKVEEIASRRKGEMGFNAEHKHACEAFLVEIEKVGLKIDMAEVAKGQRVLACYAPFVGVSLFTGSLVGGSQFRAMQRVVAATGNFSSDPARRTEQTAGLISTMALDGALSRPNGIAYKLLVNVRLLHGALRLLLARSSASSSAVEADQEVPINQHDLAITLALFSYVSLRSLERLGIQIGEKERNAYFVMWQYAGRLLGIDEDVLPNSLRDQADFFFASQRHSANPEQIPKSVLRTIDGVSEKMTSTPLGYLISPQDLNTFLEQLTVYLSGSDWVVGLGLKSLGEFLATSTSFSRSRLGTIYVDEDAHLGGRHPIYS